MSAVHPVFARDKATELAVQRLSTSTEKSSAWGNELTFYQTLNALAHLNFPQTEAQLGKAFELIFETQNTNGSWSRSEPEWNTFLTIHALKNKGLL